MANNISVNPWILDTASTTVSLKRITVNAIRWDATGAVSGNTAVLTDQNGNVIWESLVFLTGALAYSFVAFPDGQVFDGIKTGTLSSGTIYVYCNDDMGT